MTRGLQNLFTCELNASIAIFNSTKTVAQSPKMLSTLTGKLEKCLKILNEELLIFKARSVCSLEREQVSQ